VNRVLVVDDEESIAKIVSKSLRKKYIASAASSGEEALSILDSGVEFSVILSDHDMPGMTGVELLEKVHSDYPSMVRIMLTGMSQIQIAIDAINTGEVFRFLTKPASLENITRAVDEAVKQYNLQRIEKDLIENTLQESIEVIVDILKLVDQKLFNRSTNIYSHVRLFCSNLHLDNAWKYRIAALLSQIGCIGSNDNSTKRTIKIFSDVTEGDHNVWNKQAIFGGELIARIKRLELVGRIIQHQYDDEIPTSFKVNSDEESVRVGSHMLKTATYYERMMESGNNNKKTIEEMRKQSSVFSQVLIDILEQSGKEEKEEKGFVIDIAELEIDMILAKDIHTDRGLLVAKRGTALTQNMIGRMHAFRRMHGISKPIIIRSVL
jgi:CheY-like chemotaxis protein